MSSTTDTQTPESTRDGDNGTDIADSKPLETDRLRAQIATLEEENRRLRQEFVRAKRSQHRRTAVGLAIVGTVSLLAAALFPAERTVLLALGATGLFGAVLTVFLTPERFVPATVGERIYTTFADNQARLIDTLGLQDERLYVPLREQSGVRLFVPQHTEYDVPDTDVLDRPFVITEESSERGAAFLPCGASLFEEVSSVLNGDPSDSPARLAQQLADALVETFEVADSISTEVTGEQLTAGVRGSAYGDVERFDHPIASLFATALATQLSTPVELETQPADDDRADVLVVCRW